MRVSFYFALRKLVERLFPDDIPWSEGIKRPDNSEDFFREYCFVVCNAGMRWTTGRKIFERVMVDLHSGYSAGHRFKHEGKAAAIDMVYSQRERWFQDFLVSCDALPDFIPEFLGTMPWIGPITQYHLAKNLGVDCAKPDRHLERVARAYGCTVVHLCKRLSILTEDRIATVDLVIWRACSEGWIKPPYRALVS